MSTYSRLFIWVEGLDDVRFFESIVSPILGKQYGDVQIRPYASMRLDKVDNFLRSIRQMQADYVFVADIDSSTCVTARKAHLQSQYKQLAADKIIVVKAEIESWYHAGLDRTACRRFGLKPLADTEPITKERFHAMKPSRFHSGIDFMIEVLKHHHIATACVQNRSFAYFAKKYGLV